MKKRTLIITAEIVSRSDDRPFAIQFKAQPSSSCCFSELPSPIDNLDYLSARTIIQLLKKVLAVLNIQYEVLEDCLSDDMPVPPKQKIVYRLKAFSK